MRKRWLWYGLKVVFFVAIAVAAIGTAIMLLWNALLPGLFGWQTITFLQAVGLLVLSRILLGGFRGGWGQRGHWRARLAERWEQMSDEERAQFRARMQHRCGRRSEPPAEQAHMV